MSEHNINPQPLFPCKDDIIAVLNQIFVWAEFDKGTISNSSLLSTRIQFYASEECKFFFSFLFYLLEENTHNPPESMDEFVSKAILGWVDEVPWRKYRSESGLMFSNNIIEILTEFITTCWERGFSPLAYFRIVVNCIGQILFSYEDVVAAISITESILNVESGKILKDWKYLEDFEPFHSRLERINQ